MQVTEWSNYALDVRLKAAADGVSFGIIRSILGTDTFKMSAAKVIECPFTGKKYAAVPACWPDVAAIHVHEADIYGNAVIRGISVADLELARAAKRLIITAERIVNNSAIREDPTATSIPFYLVDAVVEVPVRQLSGQHAVPLLLRRGAPGAVDEGGEGSRGVREVPRHYIYGTADFEEYLERCGGLKRIEELQTLENLVDRLTTLAPKELDDMASEYNMMEMMICVASRYLEDGKTVAVGTGAPCAAAMLAQKTCSPNLVILFEAGGVAPHAADDADLGRRLADVPQGRHGSRHVRDDDHLRPRPGGLRLPGRRPDRQVRQHQLDPASATTSKPKVRFPGSGGANDFASLCWRTMIMTVHSKDAVRREVRLHHLARLPHRRRRARGGRPARGRPLQDHHRPGGHGLRPRDQGHDGGVAQSGRGA